MRFTRREVLAAFLGAPFAMAACRTGVEYFPEGEIVGANVSAGHILREMRGFEVPAANWEDIPVVIVGGGAAGLSAAWKFEREKFGGYALLELESKIGGTAQSGEGRPVGYPWGAHYLPVPFIENTDLVSLIDEMGLSEGRDAKGELVIKEQFLCREPEERFFYKGRWYEGLYLHVGASDEDKRQFAEFQKEVDRWVNWRDTNGRRAFGLPIASCSTDAEVTDLDKISFAQWLQQKGFSSERLIWYCDYATRDDYGLKLEQTSAWAGLFYFCSRVRKSGEESQPFITFPEGNGRFIKHLGSVIGEKIRAKSLVVDVASNDHGVEVVFLNTETKELRGIRAKHAIYAAPVFTAKYVIRDFRTSPPDFVGSFEHNAWFVANLFLQDRPKNRFAKDFPLSWDNVLYESPSLGYVNATHQKGIDHGPAVFTYYYPMCGEENGRAKLFSYEWKDLADVILSDLSRAHPDIRQLTSRIDVMRWGHAMISPKTGFIWGGARERAATPHRNIHFAHSDLSGLALFEEAFYQGTRAASDILPLMRNI